jgi:hypothetical protein
MLEGVHRTSRQQAEGLGSVPKSLVQQAPATCWLPCIVCMATMPLLLRLHCVLQRVTHCIQVLVLPTARLLLATFAAGPALHMAWTAVCGKLLQRWGNH